MKIRKRIIMLVMPVLLLCTSITSSAAGNSYVLDGIQRVPVPSLYEKEEVFQIFEDESGNVLELSKPQDLYISSK